VADFWTFVAALAMNPFVSPEKRSISLPNGCKDLIDVLNQEPTSHDFKAVVTKDGFLITARLPGLRSKDVEITVEQNTIRIAGKKADSSAPFDGVIDVPVGYNISHARAVYLNGELRILIPKP
jgi:HSP20 family molecular chaperone IbpA